MNWTNKKIYSDWGKVHSHVWLLLLHTSYSFGWLCMANISPSLWQDISFTSWRCHLTVAGWNIPILAATLFSFCSFCDDISDIGFQFPWDTGPGRILENDNLNHMQVGSGSTIVQSRAVGRSENLRGAISNTRSFYKTGFACSSAKIWSDFSSYQQDYSTRAPLSP